MSQSSHSEKDHQCQIRHANHWQMLALFKRTVEHQQKLPGREPYAEDETSLSPVRVLVSRPRPLDQHRNADPVVHVFHCTGSMTGGCCRKSNKLLHVFATDVLVQIVTFLHVVTASMFEWATFMCTCTAKKLDPHLGLHCEQPTSHIVLPNSNNMFLNHLLASLKGRSWGASIYIYNIYIYIWLILILFNSLNWHWLPGIASIKVIDGTEELRAQWTVILSPRGRIEFVGPKYLFFENGSNVVPPLHSASIKTPHLAHCAVQMKRIWVSQCHRYAPWVSHIDRQKWSHRSSKLAAMIHFWGNDNMIICG